MVVGFLEDRSCSVALCGNSVLVGVEENVHLLSRVNLEEVCVCNGGGGLVNRLSRISSDVVYYSTNSGRVGFVKLSGSCDVSIDEIFTKTAIDSDVHPSGHLAAVLFVGDTSEFVLMDPTRGSVVGEVTLGGSGEPNSLRVVDSSQIAVASSVVSLFDVRTSQSKKGIPTTVLTGTAGGVCYTSLDSDGAHSIVSGDSSGGVWRWDLRAADEPRNLHAHTGAVLASKAAGGAVACSSADGTVSVWSSEERKKKKEFLGDFSSLKRSFAEGSGTALGVDIEGTDIAYVTDTGIVVLSEFSTW